MGLFSDIGGLLFGSGGEKSIRRASQGQLDLQQQALDYLIESGQIPMEARDEAIQMLSGYYTGDTEAQQDLIDRVQSSPFYQQMIQTGQEGALQRAGALGLSRSGNVAQDLSRSNQGVLQSLVNQQLGGLGGLAGLGTNTNAIANQYNLMGQTTGQAGMAQAQLQQDQAGQILGGIRSGITAAFMGG